MIKKIIFFNIIILQIFVLYAKKDKKNTDNLPLLNTKWVLTGISETSALQSSDTAYIVFYENNKFSGNFGCNLFFGEFTFGKKRIKIDYAGSTKTYCMNMNLEEQFSKALKNEITHYYIEKNKLILLSRGLVICKFEGIAVPLKP
jgi:heat shock protein HslJ